MRGQSSTNKSGNVETGQLAPVWRSGPGTRMTHRAVMLKGMAGQRSYKQKRPIAEGSPAAVYPNELAKGRKYIDVLRWHHVELSKRFLAVSNGDVYEIDLMLTG